MYAPLLLLATLASVTGLALFSTTPPTFKTIRNVRDVASVSPLLRPSRLYRCGMPSNASPSDAASFVSELGIKTLVDLRSGTELREDEGLLSNDVYDGFTDVVWRRKTGAWVVDKAGRGIRRLKGLRRRGRGRGRASGGGDPLFIEDGDGEAEETDGTEGAGPRGPERHFVALMDERKYLLGTLQRLRKRTVSKLLLTSPAALASKRARARSKAEVMEFINDGGLPMLNELILQMARTGIRHVLTIIADKERHPVAVYCTAGKDRTGVLVAILLSSLGVSDEEIVGDYALSRNVYKVSEVGWGDTILITWHTDR